MSRDDDTSGRESGWALLLDLHHPADARIGDWLLGGNDNYAMDRELATRIEQALPGARTLARAHRDFVVRAARYAHRLGVRQFLDIGSGIPDIDPIHKVVDGDEFARVIYVDNDPIVLARGEMTLVDVPTAEMADGDFLFPHRILEHPRVRSTLNLDRPVCLVLAGILPLIPDDAHPATLLRQYVDRLAPGSLVILTHLAVDGLDLTDPGDAQVHAGINQVCALYEQTTTPFLTPRTAGEIAGWLDTLESLGPGITDLTSWRPGDSRSPRAVDGHMSGGSACWALVARVPARARQAS